MTRFAVLVAGACLLALLVPTADAAVPSYCYGYSVGWEGYERWCVHPDDPHCLVEHTRYIIGEEFRSCYGV